MYYNIWYGSREVLSYVYLQALTKNSVVILGDMIKLKQPVDRKIQICTIVRHLLESYNQTKK